ncbi:patatin-like phospholipase family protein [Colwellia sp. 1_MG-2023]|uniref:patatin-like phospholipase family protein n=1 Tax=Colwellia sp. 1_MG-2023 TaxID=3062649 RepID=UPI0026E185E8|nr:patatin-like phospholipase family protein [Colwellia sp. 1_MG-2023]MDO6445786.1 patatin-like phospholipase family protein [Colwellia sp. 1_MG-2023]
MIEIYAGKTALKTIQEQGFSQQLFTSMLGASGGPKWFTLFGLDKYIFGEFFQERTTPLNLIGSSAGAFRFGALAQKDPIAAITRLAKIYSETVYSEKADAIEITTKAKALLDAVYGNHGIEEIINNPIFKAHFIVAKCQGLTSFESRPLQFLGLLSSIIFNRIDRNLLKHQYQRYVFHHPNSQVKLTDHCQFDTFYQPLTLSNLKDALLASGSIPMVMQGVKDIPHSPSGMYRDGGIIDYHFDLNIEEQSPKISASDSNFSHNQSAKNDGLILYPHFNAQPKAGWFDKNLARNVQENHYKNVVMLVPSAQFVASLPFGKIPDRKDFTEMDAPTRIKYWRTVLAETERLAEGFDAFCQQANINQIKPFSF